MSNLLDEMESDVTTPTIGDNSLKEMADLCAEQASLEEEMRQLEEQLKAKAKAQSAGAGTCACTTNRSPKNSDGFTRAPRGSARSPRTFIINPDAKSRREPAAHTLGR